MRKIDRRLMLEDGSIYEGYAFGAKVPRVCEVVFNTSMTGYQELVSDPSYTDQFVVMTYPLIGNYGITDDDFESRLISVGGLIVRDYNDMPSNYRYTRTLGELLEENRVPGISGVDTRMLTRAIRDHGACRALITDDLDMTAQQAQAIIRATPIPHDAVLRVSCKKRWYARTANHRFNVVAVDCGIKQNIIRSLNQRGCNVTIVPCTVTAEEIDFMHPDGVFLSNGPGDPQDVTHVIELVRQLRGRYPMFGICLGHQMIALAYGATTYKLKFGHRGGNHPVQDLSSGRIEMTSQNHSYAVSLDSLASTPLRVTHLNLLDHTVEGCACEEDRVFSVQYHPESAPGPQDSTHLFDRFIRMMEEGKRHAQAD